MTDMTDMSFGVKLDEEGISSFGNNQNIEFLKLHNWQMEAKQYFFNHNNKAIFQVATGSGKTILAIELIKEILKIYPKTKILIMVPKNVILETGWYKELYDCGVSLVNIGVYYGNIKEYAQITITNMQNLNNIALEMFDCLILDEIHNYATDRVLDIIRSKEWNFLIGLSATVERMDNKHIELLKLVDYSVYNYTPKQAMDEDILNPFVFYNVSVELDSEEMLKYTELTTEINIIFKTYGSFGSIVHRNLPIKNKILGLLTKRKQLVNNYYRKFVVVQEIAKMHQNDKIIIFNNFNEQTNKCYWHLLENNTSKCCIVHSGIEPKRRDEALQGFKNDKYNIMLTSKVLDEGYNLPKIDTAIIMAGDSTKKQTIQRIGRVLRKKDKTSTIWQVYCKDTIEETQAIKKSIMFLELCSNHGKYEYNIDDTVPRKIL